MRCPPNGRFHFGKLGLDENASLYQTSTIIHSDTLFSALLNICAKCFPEKTGQLKNAFVQGEVAISSGFYCFEISDKKPDGTVVSYPLVYFLPKPSHFSLLNSNLKERKIFAKIAFVSKGVWERGLRPDQWTRDNDCIRIDDKFIMLTSEFDSDYSQLTKGDVPEYPELKVRSYKVKTAPKIADHARKRENNIFFQTDLLLGTNCLELNNGDRFTKSIQPHFYCLLDIKEDSSFHDLINTLFAIMADEGIGGAISTGCGKLTSCSIAEPSFTFSFQNGTRSDNYKVSASLINPDPNRLFPYRYYKTIIRGGRKVALGNTPLKRVQMLREGALIEGVAFGRIPRIHDSLPNYRNGKAFCIPIHSNYTLTEDEDL